MSSDNGLPGDRKRKAVSAALRKLSSGGSAGRARQKVGDDQTHLEGLTTQKNRLRSQELDDANTPIAATVGRTLFSTDTSSPDLPEEPVWSTFDSPSRSIVENKGLRDLIAKNTICRHCHGKLDLQFPSYGVTTIPTLVCNGRCKIKQHSAAVSPTAIPRGKHTQNADFASNVMYVLSFMACGDGGTEAQKLLGFMDLPHSSSMEKSTFTKIETKIGPYIIDIVNESMDQCLLKEVQLAAEGNPDFNLQEWKSAISGAKDNLPMDAYARLGVTYDMGWQKRSSGRRYDSNSGHGFVVGTLTRKPICMALKSKFCRICVRSPDVAHSCTVNHAGSASSMEPSALCEMTHNLFDERKVVLDHIVTDDDSTMRSRLQWSRAAVAEAVSAGAKLGKQRKRSSSGKLRYPIPEPLFMADPAHRKKSLRNRLYKLNSKRVEERHGMTESDVIRITKNFTYMTRQLPGIGREEWTNAGRAVLEHHFDNHEFCGDFCQRKTQLDSNQQDIGIKVYRCKERDALLYKVLLSIIEDYITMERLEEVGHGFDTNVNESLNQSISWFAPKNKTYCGTHSLRYRVAMAICIHILGYDAFFKLLYSRLGIEMTQGTLDFLCQQTKSKSDKKLSSQTAERKRKRNELIFEKIRQYAEKAAKDKANNEYYKSGVAMDKKRPPKVPSTRRCSYCHSVGHTITKCEQRKKDGEPNEVWKSAIAELETASQEQEYFDTLELSEDVSTATREIITAVRDDERINDFATGSK